MHRNNARDGKKCTIAWYVDDNKVSHVDEQVNTMIIEVISECVGKLTVSRVENNKFIGMDRDL